jgi:acyl dehydratase
MEISSKFTGTRIKEYQATITDRQIMNYAAGLGDANPHYFDDERDGGIVAPPMFATAVTWQISRRLWEFLDAPDFPIQLLMTQVHYSEHLILHRCIRPGDKLTVAGVITAMLPHRAGAHVVVEFKAVDKNGEPVFTEYGGVLLRGVTCTDGARGEDTLPHVPDAPGDSDPAWSETVPIDSLAAHVYDACADIHFPIHSSPKFAKSVGLAGIIYQGTATLAQAARRIVDRECGGDPARLAQIACRFGAMVWPGSDIELWLDAAHQDQGCKNLFFTVINHEERAAIKRGFAVVRNP